MALLSKVLPKKYKNSQVLFEQNLDAWRKKAEEYFATTDLNLTQIVRDTFTFGYSLDNDGNPNLPVPLQDMIGGILAGTAAITGTTADSFTINTDGNGAILSTFGMTGTFTFTFPNAGGQLTVNTATQTLTNKTLITPTIASFVNAVHNHQNAAGGGQLDIDLATTGTLPVARGGTGAITFVASSLLLGNGVGAVLSLAPGLTNQFLKGVTGADPSWGAVDLNSADVSNILPVGNGGTGTNTFTLNGVLYGNNAAAIQVTAAGAANTVLRTAGGAPSFGKVELTTDVNGILPPANGGSSGFTAKSVVFASGGGALTEDNANFYYEDGLNLLVVSGIIPPVDDTYDLGASNQPWRDVYSNAFNLVEAGTGTLRGAIEASSSGTDLIASEFNFLKTAGGGFKVIPVDETVAAGATTTIDLITAANDTAVGAVAFVYGSTTSNVGAEKDDSRQRGLAAILRNDGGASTLDRQVPWNGTTGGTAVNADLVNAGAVIQLELCNPAAGTQWKWKGVVITFDINA